MPRQEILYQPGKVYHIYNHANGFENLFEKRDHYMMFLNSFLEKCGTIFTTYAFVLMPNHFHLVVKVNSFQSLANSIYNLISAEQENMDRMIFEYELSKQISIKFGAFLSSYVQKYNKRIGRSGNLFQENTRRKLVDTDEYLKTVIKYVHMNPVKDGFCDDPKKWQYSSYPFFLNNENEIIPVDQILKIYGGFNSFLRAHEEIDIDKI